MSEPVSHPPSSDAPSPPEHRTRVLYVESSPEQRARVRSVVEARGFEFDEATDAREALDRAVTSHPDLVLVDGHLAGALAGDVARELRGGNSLTDVPLIVHAGEQERAQGLGAGFDGFLTEPLDDSTLLEQLRTYLGKKPTDGVATRMHELEREVASTSGENTRLRERARVRSEFMRNLAHELATPLTPLVGYLKLLRSNRLGPLTDRQIQVIDAMVHATERLGHSIDNLVDYASLEVGRFPVIPSDFDAAPMLDELVQELNAKARSKHLRVDFLKGERIAIRGDPRKLRQALANVLDNAVKASPHGGRILVEVKDRPDGVSFAVYDQGPGLPVDLQRMTETADPLRTDERAGSVGLGLPMARRIIMAHGGRMTLESPPQDQPDVRDLFPGSKVTLWLPRQAPAV